MTFLRALQKRAEAQGVRMMDIIEYLQGEIITDEGDILSDVPIPMRRFYEVDIEAVDTEAYSNMCNFIVGAVKRHGTNKLVDVMALSYIRDFIFSAFCSIEYTTLKPFSEMNIKEEFKYLDDLTNDLLSLRQYRDDYEKEEEVQDTPLVIEPEESNMKEIDKIIESIQL